MEKKGVLIIAIVGIVLIVLGVLGYNFVKDIGNCKYNPAKCPEIIKKLFSPSDFEVGFDSGFTGPGGCTGPDCEIFCQQNPIECQNWCKENPETCNKLMEMDQNQGFAGREFNIFGEELIDPPKTTIEFEKSVNINDGSLTTEQDLLKLKELNVNMVTIWPARLVKNDEFIFYPQRISNLINLAHKNGLQVELRSSIIFPDLVKDYNKYKINSLEHVKEYAQFAEKHKVYRIIPFGEIDNDFLNHCEKITEFSKEMLAEIRKHYSGQVGIGVVAPWRDCGFTFEGYDYLTVSAYVQNTEGVDDEIDMEKWFTQKPDANPDIEMNLALLIKWAREVADRSGIEKLHIAETGVINPEDGKSIDEFNTIVVGKEKEAEFYQNLFEQAQGKIDGFSGVFYNPEGSFMTINGDPAEEVIKKWYQML